METEVKVKRSRSETVKDLWASPEYRAKQMASRAETDQALLHDRLSTAARGNWSNPEWRTRMMESRAASPLYSGKGSVRAEKIGSAALARWADPAFRLKHALTLMKPTTIDGFTYPSRKAAQAALGITGYKLDKLLRSQG